MIEATCHCGDLRLRLSQAPTRLTDCNCSICRRYGVLWAYYAKAEVEVIPPDGAAQTYVRDDQQSLAFHRCARCGCVSHWEANDPALDRVAINARLLPPETLEEVPVRRFDGAVTFTYLD